MLVTRALDGVEVPVWFRGEKVGTRRLYDTRLLLAHLGRLDRGRRTPEPAPLPMGIPEFPGTVYRNRSLVLPHHPANGTIPVNHG